MASPVKLRPLVVAQLILASMTAAVPSDFECAWRTSAMKYASTLQPWLTPQQRKILAASLNVEGSSSSPPCTVNENINPLNALNQHPSTTIRSSASIFIVDPMGIGGTCDDSNAGTLPMPLCTISAAVDKCRLSKSQPDFPNDADSGCNVELRSGKHRLKEEISLTSRDSGMLFQAYAGEIPIVTGAQLISNPKWEKAGQEPQQARRCQLFANTDVQGGNDLPGSPLILENASNCASACEQNVECVVAVYVSHLKECYIKHEPAALKEVGASDADHTGITCSGNYGSLWKAYMSGISNIADITALFINGTRGVRARYPDANPETDKFPIGYITGPTTWLPPKDYGPIKYINYSETRPEYVNLFQNYRGGVGGACSVYDPPFSYWCAENPQGGGASQFILPSGLHYNAKQLPKTPYKNATGAILWAWRPGHWANWAFEIGEDNGTAMTFAKGGFQGGRGNQHGAEWYIENVFEECDHPNEFYFDSKSKTLYYYTNTSEAPIGVFEAPQLKTLFRVQGTQSNPVNNITFKGISFTGSAYTYLDPHSPPSGGDWALQRSGALFFEGTTLLTIEDCVLTRLDGNGIMLSGFNQNSTIRRNHIAYTGDTAIAAWGHTKGSHPDQPEGTGPDGTDGNFPRFTVIDSNFIHHLGIHEKQSSCFFQAKTAESTLVGNICFEIPRAGFNLNDGFGGGNHVYNNLLFNTCGESGDHGAINTWDRQAFLTTVATGQPSYVPAVNEINNNFIVSNGDANGGAIDNDDGSSHYNEHHNFCIYGGAKMGNIDGHAKVYHNNINAYAHVYGKTCDWQWPGWFPKKPYEEQYFNNTCILGAGDSYIKMSGDCSFQNSSSVGTIVHGNTVYSPGGNSAMVQGCGKTINASDWLKLGMDPGTSLRPSISSAEIMMMGAALLGF